MDHNEDEHLTKPARLVTFGSLVNINLEDNFSLYLYGEGYMEGRIQLKKFDATSQSNKDIDFSYCIYMILPFPNMSSFKYQQNIIDIIENEKGKLAASDKLSERKNKINEIKNKLQSELNFNITNVNRNKGNKILLVNSNFLLFHMNTMKYLSVDMNNTEKPYVTMVDYPNIYSFFKFMPCLQLQLQRNDNFVYEEELFNICTAESLNGKNAYVMVDYRHSDMEEDEHPQGHGGNSNVANKIKSNKQSKFVYGSIDNKKAWKLNLYEEPNMEPPESESHCYLKIGDCLWIVLSEQKYYLSSQRQKDPFLECLQIEQEIQQEQLHGGDQQKINKRRQAVQMNKGKTKVLTSEKILPSWDKVPNETNILELQEDIFDNFDVSFCSIGGNDAQNDMIQLYELNSNGIWRIESINFQDGGELLWQTPYRLRHIISGKYLSVTYDEHNIQIIDLTFNKENKNTFFSFQKIDNLMNKYISKVKIHQDAYFRILHIETNCYIGFDEEKIYDSLIKSETYVERTVPIKFYGFLKEINTFRFRKSKFADQWESNYLLSTFPLFSSIPNLIVNTCTPAEQLRDETKKFSLFDLEYQRMQETLKKIQNFLINQNIANMVLDQEFNYPCQSRQNIFREQCIFGLLIWVLSKVFPSPQEFTTHNIDHSMDIIYSDPFSGVERPQQEVVEEGEAKQLQKNQTLNIESQNAQLQNKDQNIQNQNSFKDKIMRNCEQHVKKRFILSYSIYQIIKFSCFNNIFNQKYFSHFIYRLAPHIGYGDFVSETLEFCFMKNMQILQVLHSLEFPKENTVVSVDSANIFSEEKDKTTEGLLDNLVKRLKRFAPYTKSDIIQLLGSMCSLGKQTVFVNQEKIFNSFLNNRPIIFSCLLKIYNENGTLIIEKREKQGNEYEFKPFSLESFETKLKEPVLKKYFIKQIELYAKMCQDRNYNCSKSFSLIFEEQICKRYINSKRTSIDTKALFTKLLLNIYIDKEPRLIIKKPNLVRVFREPSMSQSDAAGLFSLILDPDVIRMVKNKSTKSKVQQEDNNQILSQMGQKMKGLTKKQKDDITISFIKKNISNQEQQLKEMRLLILEITRQCYMLVIGNPSLQPKAKRKDKTVPLITEALPHSSKNSGRRFIKSKIYNTLTLEIIKSFHVMLKFGMFTFLVDDQSVPTMETIVEYLVFLLEYDEQYYNELGGHQPILQRRYIENQKKQEDIVANIMGMAAIGSVGGGAFKAINNLLVTLGILEEEDEEEKDEQIIKNLNGEQQEKGGSFLNLYQSLLKLISKYQNKIYQKQEFKIEIEQNIEIKIKIEICDIIDYLLNWREEYYLDCVTDYFKDVFFVKNRGKAKENIEYKKEDIPELFPENNLLVGEQLKPYKKQGDFVPKPAQVKSIDEIIQRPFIEVLLSSFYFSNNSEFQNKLIDLIQRTNTQRSKLLNNIGLVNLVSSNSSDNAYQRMSKCISQLRALLSYSQSWLQIVEQQKYNEKSEENLDVTFEKFQNLYDLLYENTENLQNVQLKQKIFKHLQGDLLVMKFIENAQLIFQQNFKYFDLSSFQSKAPDKGDFHPYSYKKTFIEKLYTIFNTCHQILCFYCRFNNTKGQNSTLKNYSRLLDNQTFINIGQIDLICEIFRNNSKNSIRQESEIYIHYLIKLLKIHGHYYQFLEPLQIMFDSVQADENLLISKKILSFLLEPDNIDITNAFCNENVYHSIVDIPFYPIKNQKKYKEKYIQVLTYCLKSDIGVNWVTKVYHAVTIDDLIQLLYEESIVNSSAEIQKEELQISRLICDILMIFFSKLEKTLKDFNENQEKFTEIIIVIKNRIKTKTTIKIPEQNYIIDHILPLINCYVENFLKDMIIISLMSIESKSEFERAKHMFSFCQILVQNLFKFFDIIHFTNLDQQSGDKLRIIAKLATNLKVKIPQEYILLKDIIEQMEREKMGADGQEIDELEQLKQDHQKEHNDLYHHAIQTNSLGIDQSQTQLNIHKLKSVLSVIHVSKSMGLSVDDNKQPANTTGSPGKSTSPRTNQFETIPEFQQLWNIYKEKISDNQLIKKLVKDEGRRFIKNIIGIDQLLENPQEARDKEIIISKEDLIIKFLQFLEYWKEKGGSKNSAIFILKFVRHIIIRGGDEEQEDETKKISDEEKQQNKVQRQNLMNSLNITNITLQLFWKESGKDKTYLYYLARLIISLLDGGNVNIQKQIYNLFLSNNQSEKFFRQLSGILNEEINLVKKSNGTASSIGSGKSGDKKNKPLIQSALRIMQLFCEGHYTEMQDYMRYQKNSKISYNMVNNIIQLVTSFKISNTTQNAVQQSMDTLTEIVQGPCNENQLIIAQSKFLEFAVSILREEAKIFDWVTVQEQMTDQEIKQKRELAQTTTKQYYNKKLQDTRHHSIVISESTKEKGMIHNIIKKQSSATDMGEVNLLKSSNNNTKSGEILLKNSQQTNLQISGKQTNDNTNVHSRQQSKDSHAPLIESQMLQSNFINSPIKHNKPNDNEILLQQTEGRQSQGALHEIPEEIDEHGQEVSQGQLKSSRDIKSGKGEGGGNDPAQSQTELVDSLQQPQEQNDDKVVKFKYVKKLNVRKGYIVRIKHKCIITILSLLELSLKEHGIANRIRRTLPISILIDNLRNLYSIYKNTYKNDYFSSCFNKMNNKFDESKPDTEADELIIELGFNIFILINILIIDEPKLSLDNEQQEIYDIILENNQIANKGEGSLLGGSFLGNITKLGSDLLSNSLGALKDAADKAKELTLNEEEKEALEKKKAEEKEKQKVKIRNEALQFFCENTLQIEFIRHEQVGKCYFPLLPFCKTLPKENKENFHEGIDIQNAKAKLRSIMEESESIIKVMRHEEELREIFIKNFLLSLIASNKQLWEDLAFIINCLLNLTITFSYSEKFFDQSLNESNPDYQQILYMERMWDPRLFNNEQYTWTPQLLTILGLINLVLSSMVVFFFCIKKAPLLLKDMWVEWYNANYGSSLLKLGFFIFNIIKSVYAILNDFDFVYYAFYMIFCVLGLMVHPFYFGCLTVDFLRIKFLKNVVKAVWIPRDSLGLTFLVFLMAEYYFTIIGYIYFYDNFPNEECHTLWICFVKVFDYTYKGGSGSLGSNLQAPELDGVLSAPVVNYDGEGNIIGIKEIINSLYLARFFYDNVFLWIIIILLTSMTAGIIIDTFGSLKQEAQEKEEHLEQFCFICGFDREKIDKSYEIQNGFLYHIKKHHYLWNYVFFKAYLDFKDQTEFSGNETYIIQQYQTKDVSWFPQRQSLLIIDDEAAENEKKKAIINEIDKFNQRIQDQIQQLQVKVGNLNE